MHWLNRVEGYFGKITLKVYWATGALGLLFIGVIGVLCAVFNHAAITAADG